VISAMTSATFPLLRPSILEYRKSGRPRWFLKTLPKPIRPISPFEALSKFNLRQERGEED